MIGPPSRYTGHNDMRSKRWVDVLSFVGGAKREKGELEYEGGRQDMIKQIVDRAGSREEIGARSGGGGEREAAAWYLDTAVSTIT